METMYNLKSIHLYCVMDNFKAKQADLVKSMIGSGRMADYIKFNNYANLSFNEGDEHRHEFPIVTMQDSFNRSKTNCLAYDIIDEYSLTYYDKLFIYTGTPHKDLKYGYYLFNSKTNECLHVFEIDGPEDWLVIRICKSFNAIKKYKTFNEHLKKSEIYKALRMQ